MGPNAPNLCFDGLKPPGTHLPVVVAHRETDLEMNVHVRASQLLGRFFTQSLVKYLNVTSHDLGVLSIDSLDLMSPKLIWRGAEEKDVLLRSTIFPQKPRGLYAKGLRSREEPPGVPSVLHASPSDRWGS